MERTLRDNEHVFALVMLEPNGKRKSVPLELATVIDEFGDFFPDYIPQGYPWFETYKIVSIWCRDS